MTLIDSRGLCLAGLACLWTLPLAAQDKFVAADATYTATADNTKNSHYFVDPQAGTPANWKVPIDYSAGTIEVRMDVQEKPSNAATLVNVCFQGNVETCANYPPAYTKTGAIEFTAKISSFWQYSMFDWTKGIQSIGISLKDDKQNLAQGNAMFYPTKVHLTVTVVGPADSGGDDDPPPAADAGTPRDAGAPTRDAGGMIPQGPNPAGVGAPITPPSGTPAGKAATPPVTPAQPAGTGAAAGTVAAGTSAPSTSGAATTAGGPAAGGTNSKVTDYLESDTGCAVGGTGSSTLWPLGIALGLLLRRRRRHKLR